MEVRFSFETGPFFTRRKKVLEHRRKKIRRDWKEGMAGGAGDPVAGNGSRSDLEEK